MRHAALLLALWAGLAGPAAALSCLAPDPEQSFDAALEAEARYIVVHGGFAFDPAALPGAGGVAPDDPVAVAARFEGMGLSHEGFAVPLAMAVTLNVTCLDPWCGSLQPGAPHLAFLRREVGAYVLDLPPCPTWAHAAPTEATLERMLACLRDDGCAP